MIKVEKGVVEITEVTAREIIRAIDRAKEEVEFTDEPLPDGDMAVETYKQKLKECGTIFVESPFSGISFKVRVEKRPCSQESLGYI